MIDRIVTEIEKLGQELLILSQKEYKIFSKEDDSPVTEGDYYSHKMISGILPRFLEAPILSEEGEIPDYEIRKDWRMFWMLDPIDGTREFIAKSDNFAINIALIEFNKPIMGLIHFPKKSLSYFATASEGAFKKENGQIIRIGSSKFTRNLKIIAPHSCINQVREFAQQFPGSQIIETKGIARFDLMAEGCAEILPHYSKSFEWDTAPGHLIAEEAGCTVLRLDNNSPLEYNKENLENPPFIVTCGV